MTLLVSYKRICINASIVCATLGVLLVSAYVLFGHLLIKAAYDSDVAIFQEIMAAKNVMSLQDYFAAVDKSILSLATLFIVGAPVLLLAINPLGLALSGASLLIGAMAIFLLLDLVPSLVKPLHFDMLPYYNYRLTYLPDPLLGFRERPNYRARINNFRGFGYSPLYGIKVPPQTIIWETDQQGFRNESEVPFPEVVVVGSSFPEYGNDLGDTYSSRLDKLLGGKKVVNLAKAGYGPIEYLRVFEIHALQKKPSYAILALNAAGDIDDHLAAWVRGRRDSSLAKASIAFGRFLPRYETAVKQAWHMATSAGWTALQLGFTSLVGSESVHPDVAVLKFPNGTTEKMVFLDLHTAKSPDELLHSRPWDALKKILVEFKELSEENQIVPLLLYVPGATEIYSQYSTVDSGANWLRLRDSQIETSGSNEEAIRRLAAELGIKLIDLRPAFQEAARSGKLVYYRLDSHWNAEGRKIAASITADALKSLRVETPSVLDHSVPAAPQKNRKLDPVLQESALDREDGIMMRSLAGKINFWNLGAQRLYGWSRDEAIGQVSHDLLRTQFPEPLIKIDSELVQSGEWHGKLVHETRDGRRVVVESRWVLDPKGHPGAVIEINTPSDAS